MARGTVYKRCPCRDEQGKRLKSCRKDHGTWWYKVEGPPSAETGRRRQVAKGGFRTRVDAEAALTKVNYALEHGQQVFEKKTTLGDWLDLWLEELATKRSVKTLANYRGHVRDVWKPILGRVQLRSLTRQHIETALADLDNPIFRPPGAGNVGRRIAHRSPATIDGYRRTLRAALSVARRRGLIAINPAEGRMDAIPEHDRRLKLSIWEPEQTAQFLEHVAEDRLSALYELAAYAGLRRAELCGLRWSDIDADGRGIMIQQTIVEVASKELRPEDRICTICRSEHVSLLFKMPKSRAGLRWVPLVGAAQRALEARRATVEADKRACGSRYRDHDLVFCHVDGDPLRPSSVTLAFEAHRAACGLPRIRLHDTRHGACSLLLAAGVPIEVVQMILGHSSPTVTRQVYAHVMKRSTGQQVERAAEMVDRFRRGHSADTPTDPEGVETGGEEMN